MRTISLWQPWAELIVRGLKRYETRSWEISYRGVIAIHAAKRKFRSEDMLRESRQQLVVDEVDPFYLKYGCVLGFAEVVDCLPVEQVRDEVLDRELLYGNYDDGRFAWRFERVIALPEPVALSGHQGIFFWREGVEIYKRLKDRAA